MSIENEDALSRVATNLALIAGAISTLAEAVNGTYKGKPIYAQNGAEPPVEPQKRGRGRPAKGEESAPPSTVPATVQAAAAPVAASTAPVATPAAIPATDDPFAAAPATSVATLDDVRKALTALRAATSQEKALGVLRTAAGADNLTSLAADKYGVVVAAVNVELRIAAAAKPAPVVETDPFETPAAVVGGVAQVIPTLEDVKAVIVETQKRTSQDTVQKVVMAHGGKATKPEGGEGPSLKALPESAFAATIAALKALPATK